MVVDVDASPVSLEQLLPILHILHSNNSQTPIFFLSKFSILWIETGIISARINIWDVIFISSSAWKKVWSIVWTCLQTQFFQRKLCKYTSATTNNTSNNIPIQSSTILHPLHIIQTLFKTTLEYKLIKEIQGGNEGHQARECPSRGPAKCYNCDSKILFSNYQNKFMLTHI